jgi:hypothetical protein
MWTETRRGRTTVAGRRTKSVWACCCVWGRVGGGGAPCLRHRRPRACPAVCTLLRAFAQKPTQEACLLRFPPCLRRVPCPHSHTAPRTQAVYHTAPLGGGGGAGFAVRADSAMAAPARGLSEAVGGLKVETPKSQCRSVFTTKSLTANMPKCTHQSGLFRICTLYMYVHARTHTPHTGASVCSCVADNA